MNDLGNVLIICREPEDLKIMPQYKNGMARQPIIVASDCDDIQRAALEKPGVDKVCFIEQMESFFAVADDVLRIVDQLNMWLASLTVEAGNLAEGVLYFERWAEGNSVATNVQDVLLLIRSYQHLFAEKQISRVIISRHLSHQWEDDVLIHTASICGLKVEVRSSVKYRVARILDLSITNWRLLVRYRVSMPRRILFFLQSWVLLGIKVIRAKLHKQNKYITPEGKFEIAFQLGSSAKKHVENIVYVMKEFQARSSYAPVALCWQAASGADQVRREGLIASELEAWFPLAQLFTVIRCVRKIQELARKKKSELITNSVLAYQGVSLAPLLLPFIECFFHTQVVHRIVLKMGAECYFDQHKPVAMKSWGDDLLPLGRMCKHVMQKKLWVKQSICFQYFLGYTIETPYASYNSDIYFVSNEFERWQMIRQGAKPEKVIVVGRPRYSGLEIFRQHYCKQDSREILGLPPGNHFCTFYASDYPIRGCTSMQEYTEAANALIAFFKQGIYGTLIIKPHPSDSTGFFDVLAKTQGYSKSLFWYDKAQLPYHGLNAADMVITKFSTVGFEAFLFDKPLISVALDEESRFQDVYGDVAERFTSVEGVTKFLEKIIKDPDTRKEWEGRQAKLRRGYMSERAIMSNKPAVEAIADTLEEYLMQQHILRSSEAMR